MVDPIQLPSPEKSVVHKGRYIRIGDTGYGLASGTATVYQAEVLSLSGVQAAPGQDVFILADRIVAPNATLDVSGAAGTPSYLAQNKAPGGATPGAKGTDADKSQLPRAGKGQDSGNVTIVCRSLEGSLKIIANGGQGGDGLNGGDGAKGAQGAPGGDRVINRNAARGGTGKQGGQAGDGGSPGNGGNAGKIRVFVRENTASLVTVAVRGSPGKPGSKGTEGEGGDPGPPGVWGHMASQQDRGKF